MDSQYPPSAVDFGRIAAERCRRFGGFGAARSGLVDAAVAGQALDLLGELGVHDIDATCGVEEALAAAQLVRAVGASGLPAPVVPALLAAAGAGWTVVIDQPTDRVVRIDYGALDLPWRAQLIDGRVFDVVDLAGSPGQKLAPFQARGRLSRPWDADHAEVIRSCALSLNMQSWWLLGAAETAVEMALTHTSARTQFGARLQSFQSVQFALAEMYTAVRSLEALAKYTTWAWHGRPADALVDSLALRSVALEAAATALGGAHQLHGAIGFSDEHDLSILSRLTQAFVRQPFDYERTGELLVNHVDSTGFDALFGRGDGSVSTQQLFPARPASLSAGRFSG